LLALGLMDIEKSFLNKLQSKPSFLDKVIDLFAKKNRRIINNKVSVSVTVCIFIYW
jgi:hypothetical protein